MNFEEVRKYYHNGRLDSMRLSLGKRWEDVMDIIFSHIKGLDDDTFDIYETQKENISLEDEVENLEETIEGMQVYP